MRTAAPLLALALLGCSSTPTAPTITAFSYSPMQLPINMQSSVSGSASFRDPEANCHLLVIGFIDPKGVLAESPPQETGTESNLTATIGFSAKVTPIEKGTYELSVHFVDDTGLSSESRTGPVDVQ